MFSIIARNLSVWVWGVGVEYLSVPNLIIIYHEHFSSIVDGLLVIEWNTSYSVWCSCVTAVLLLRTPLARCADVAHSDAASTLAVGRCRWR